MTGNKQLKQAHPYNDLSDRVCRRTGCARRIKERMVLLVDARDCYPCHRAAATRGK